jgi:adenine-specific DNA-methyltransferase
MNPTQPNPTQPNPTQPNPTQPNPTQPNPTMEQPLSARECEMLELIAHGHKDREIALALDIEECTVRFHVK